ncbi:MAG TPA: hypothetical protein VK970_16160 [Candidatus Methylacidiphilales bacterium]|nr:hypothetical protein [Candidatus Methylacidiphilales bacterium]
MKRASFPLSTVRTLAFAAATFLATLYPASAADPRTESRIDIIGSGSVDISATATGATTERATWPGTQPAKHIVVKFAADEVWKESSVTITPSHDGTIYLLLMGPHVKVSADTKEIEQIRICYDNIRTDAAEIRNGSFEDAGGPDKIEGWKRVDLAPVEPLVTEANGARVETGSAVDGKCYASVWHHSRLGQSISVTAGYPVTITFSYRLDKP